MQDPIGLIAALGGKEEFVRRLDSVFRQREIQNVQIVPNVRDVFAARYHNKAHLCMPAKDDLRGGYAVGGGDGADGFIRQQLPGIRKKKKLPLEIMISLR